MMNSNHYLDEQEQSYNIIDTFLETPTAPVLKEIGEVEALKKLHEISNDESVKKHSYRQLLSATSQF